MMVHSASTSVGYSELFAFVRLNVRTTATMKRYRSRFRIHDVDVREIAGWLHLMESKGLSPKTIANVHGLPSSR